MKYKKNYRRKKEVDFSSDALLASIVQAWFSYSSSSAELKERPENRVSTHRQPTF